MAIPPEHKVLQSLWIGRPLSIIERLCIQSFLANGHEFHLFCYKPVENVPEGTTIRDAREIMPESEIFVNESEGFGKGSYSPFSDIFRMMLVHKIGGWWVDTDIICLKPINITQKNLVAGSDEREYGTLANPNVLFFEKGHPLPKWCVERLLKAKHDGKVIHAGGPLTLQAAVKEFKMPDLVAPPYLFNPIQWRYVKYMINPEENFFHPRRVKRTLGITERLGRVTDQTLTLHLWNEVWTNAGLDRNATYHPQGHFEQLKAKYLR